MKASEEITDEQSRQVRSRDAFPQGAALMNPVIALV